MTMHNLVTVWTHVGRLKIIGGWGCCGPCLGISVVSDLLETHLSPVLTS